MKTCTASRFYMHVSLMYPYLSWFSYLSMTYWAIQCACAPRKELSTDWLGISPYLACTSIILQYLYHSCRMVQFGRVWDMTDMTGRWQQKPSRRCKWAQDAGQQQHSLGDATPRRMAGSLQDLCSPGAGAKAKRLTTGIDPAPWNATNIRNMA